MKKNLNKIVALMSVIAGILTWFGCRYLYTTYHDTISGPIMIAILCSALFTAVFLAVWVGSILTGSFDRNSHLYSDTGSMVSYFLSGLLGVFLLSMFLEYIYELNPNVKVTQPTSYVFVIDESGSMSSNDSSGLRYDAIPEIMEAEEENFPYMVYTFSNDTQIIRDMGPMNSEYEKNPIVSYGGTAIRGTILQILKDYKEGVWDGGENPKVIFLTDGAATDLSNGFLWFKGNVSEFNTALEEYKNLGISISTVGLGSVDREVMTRMAETTGGVFVHVQNAADLTSAMKTAATTYSERNLLSIRYIKHLDTVYGMLRILFLSMIGTLIGSLILFAYMEVSSIPIIILSSIFCSLLGSILFEAGLKNGVLQSILWFILWILFSLTIGYIYPKGGNSFVIRTNDYYMHDK